MKKYIGPITFFGFTVLWALFFVYVAPKSDQEMQGIPHNFWVPDVLEYESDTIYGDSIIYCRYTKEQDHLIYWNGDTLICMGCDHVFVLNKQKTHTTCTCRGCSYSDEHVMWVAGNGDTIWE